MNIDLTTSSTNEGNFSASDLKQLLLQTHDAEQKRQDIFKELFLKFGIDTDKYAIVLHSKYEVDLALLPKNIELHFSQIADEDKITILPKGLIDDFKVKFSVFGSLL